MDYEYWSMNNGFIFGHAITSSRSLLGNMVTIILKVDNFLCYLRNIAQLVNTETH